MTRGVRITILLVAQIQASRTGCRGNTKEHNDDTETSRGNEAFILGALFISEPSGRTAPKGTGDGLKYRGVEGESLALACAAQGFPAPITRYTHLRKDLSICSP